MLEFESDDNVPSELLDWMKTQQSLPTCVALGSNASYCAIGTTNGAPSYQLSKNFQDDLDLDQFLKTAKESDPPSLPRVVKPSF
jgi:hypothetical protein